MLNELNDDTGFYKLFPIESRIPFIAETSRNAYLVCIFATSRYTYDAQKHGGLLSQELADANRQEWLKLRNERE